VRQRLALFAVSALLIPLLVAAEPAPVSARLIADRAQPEAEEPMHLGVELRIAPGWHVYWQNPGEAGLATEVDLDLPAGLDAAPLRWPIPDRFTQPGGILGFGYHGTVLLATTITGSVNRSTQDAVRARVSWLACKDICVLGDAELEDQLPLTVEAGRFQTWRGSLPAPVDVAKLPFTLTTSSGDDPDRRTLWLSWRQEPLEVEWFPNPGPGLEVRSAQPRTRASLTRIDFDARLVDGATAPPEEIPSVIVVTDRGGTRRGWEIPIPLT
jgi:thiol:disulfide interchange protein DsbD